MSIYHQIFNPTVKWESPIDIQRLEPFMFLEKKQDTNIKIKTDEELPTINELKCTVTFGIENTERCKTQNDVDLEKNDSNNNNKYENPNIITELPTKNREEMVNVIVQEHYYPKKPDSLFWCLFIALYGYKEYNQIDNHYSNVEMVEKQKLMELMKKSPNMMKTSDRKITKVLSQEIMSDFMTNKKTTNPLLEKHN